MLWFAHTDRYAGKLLRVSSGRRLSLQYHERKDETSYLLSGRMLLTQGEDPESLEEREIAPGTAWRNATGVVHTIEALEDAVVLEVSTPELDGVVRLGGRKRLRVGPSHETVDACSNLPRSSLSRRQLELGNARVGLAETNRWAART